MTHTLRFKKTCNWSTLRHTKCGRHVAVHTSIVSYHPDRTWIKIVYCSVVFHIQSAHLACRYRMHIQNAKKTRMNIHNVHPECTSRMHIQHQKCSAAAAAIARRLQAITACCYVLSAGKAVTTWTPKQDTITEGEQNKKSTKRTTTGQEK